MRNLILAAVAASIPAVASAAPVAYDGSQSTIQWKTPLASGCACWTGTQYINGTKIVYDSATNSYTVRDTGDPATTSTFTGGTVGADYTTYAKTTGSVTESLKVLNKANTILPLTYVQYGKWRRTGLANYFPNNDTYVVFGTKTPRSAVPTSGTGTYALTLDGTYINKNGVFDVDGTGSLVATFGPNTLTYSATATGAREGGGTGITFGTMTGTGSITNGGPAFKGTGAVNGSGYAMNVMGNFYGPAAEEIGGNFTIKGNSATLAPGSGTGAFVGKK